MTIIMEAIYRLNFISINFLILFFTKIENLILNLLCKQNQNHIKAILSKKSSEGGITKVDFKLYYRVIVIKTAQSGTKINMRNN
jgi:hypothetical protein